MALGDKGGLIRRCIVNDYELVEFPDSPTCRMQRVKRCAEQTFLVVGWDNERDHVSIRMPNKQFRRRLASVAIDSAVKWHLTQAYLDGASPALISTGAASGDDRKRSSAAAASGWRAITVTAPAKEKPG